jgi:acyl dehydratase
VPPQTHTHTQTLTQAQFDRFARLSGDDNPIHTDPAFAARTRFGQTAAHGMFLYSLLSGLAGRLHPGAAPLLAEFTFRAPTFTGRPVHLHLSPLPAPGPQKVFALRVEVRQDGAAEPGLEGRLLLLEEPAGPSAWAAAAAEIEAAGGGAAEDRSGPESAPAYKGLEPGQTAHLERAFSPADLDEYAALAGESNPLFTRPDRALSLGLTGSPVPGPLLGALFSCLLGTRLPGPGTNWLKQRLLFRQPAYPGQLLRAEVQITRLRPEKNLANLSTRAWDPAGRLVCTGEALVLVADVAA